MALLSWEKCSHDEHNSLVHSPIALSSVVINAFPRMGLWILYIYKILYTQEVTLVGYSLISVQIIGLFPRWAWGYFDMLMLEQFPSFQNTIPAALLRRKRAGAIPPKLHGSNNIKQSKKSLFKHSAKCQQKHVIMPHCTGHLRGLVPKNVWYPF